MSRLRSDLVCQISFSSGMCDTAGDRHGDGKLTKQIARVQLRWFGSTDRKYTITCQTSGAGEAVAARIHDS